MSIVIYYVGRMNSVTIRRRFIGAMLDWLEDCSSVSGKTVGDLPRDAEVAWLGDQYNEIDGLFHTYAYVLEFGFARKIRAMMRVVLQDVRDASMDAEHAGIVNEHIVEMESIIARSCPREYLWYRLWREGRARA